MKKSFDSYPLTKSTIVITVVFILLSISKVIGPFTDNAGFWLLVLIYILYRLES